MKHVIKCYEIQIIKANKKTKIINPHPQSPLKNAQPKTKSPLRHRLPDLKITQMLTAPPISHIPNLPQTQRHLHLIT